MNLDQSIWTSQCHSDEKAVILDVRTPEEFELSRIPNSKNIDFYNPQNFMQEIEKLDKDNNYYVYCRTGVRSANSCQLMSELGFKNVYNLVGGIVEWNGEIIN
jgi:rhodanese-related sulfurtransferase